MIAKKTRVRKGEGKLFQGVVIAAVFLLVFGVGVGFLIFQNIRIHTKHAALEHKLADLQSQAEELSSQKADIEQQLNNLGSEEYQEKVLREQGLYQKPGEDVITVLPVDEGGVEVEQEETVDTSKTWWKPWTWF